MTVNELIKIWAKIKNGFARLNGSDQLDFNANNLNANTLTAKRTIGGSESYASVAPNAIYVYNGMNDNKTTLYFPSASNAHTPTSGTIALTSDIPDMSKYDNMLDGVVYENDLFTNNKIKSDLLPSYVDDVVDGYYNILDGKMYTYLSNCPEGEECTYTKLDIEISGELGKIYYAVNNKKIYRFNEGTGHFFDIVDEPDLTDYYTKTEADAKFAAIDDIVEGGITQNYADAHYAPISTTYSKSEVDSEILNSTSVVCGFYKNSTTFKPGSYESGVETYTEDYDTLLAKENILYVDVKDHKIYYYDIIQRKYIALNELTAAQIDEICLLDDSGSDDGEPD